MIDAILARIRGGILYVRKHPQLILTLFLILAIPLAFLWSGQQFLKASRENQQTLEKNRIGIFHDVFVSYLKSIAFSPEKIQEEIVRLVSENPDIEDFLIAEEISNDITIIASSDTSIIGSSAKSVETLRIARTVVDRSMILPYSEGTTRYWLSARFIEHEGKEYYLYTRTSLASLDNALKMREQEAYLWLAGILVIILTLLVRQVRLIDYGYLYREMKRANEMKDLFTNMIAHELRAPLTAMRGYASMIREHKSVTDDVKTSALRIEEASERLIVIVSDLLDVARIQSGKLSVEKIPVDITAVITGVVDALRPSARGKQIDIMLEGVKAALIVQGDGKRLNQALTNLVSNAIKYTPKGSITISLEDRRDRVELRVKDTGMGIRAEDQKSLFAPFFRVQTDDVSKITGTGLGMWITKQLIELMGGSIGVESIRGVGTHVVITLPK